MLFRNNPKKEKVGPDTKKRTAQIMLKNFFRGRKNTPEGLLKALEMGLITEEERLKLEIDRNTKKLLALTKPKSKKK